MLRWNKDKEITDWMLSTFVTFVESSKWFVQLLVFKKISRKPEIKKLAGSYLSISNLLFNNKRFIPLVKLFNKLSDTLWKSFSSSIIIDEGLIFSAINL